MKLRVKKTGRIDLKSLSAVTKSNREQKHEKGAPGSCATEVAHLLLSM